MAMPTPVPALHEYTVLQRRVDDLGAVEYRVSAAYFIADGPYTLFKNAAHAAVAAFPTDSVLLISRESAAHAA